MAASLTGCVALVIGGAGASSAADVDLPFTASCHGWQFPPDRSRTTRRVIPASRSVRRPWSRRTPPSHTASRPSR